MKEDKDYDFNFIENSLQMLGVRMRQCECCDKKILTSIPSIDRMCEECFKAQKKLKENFKSE